jgi:hypothetical protein
MMRRFSPLVILFGLLALAPAQVSPDKSAKSNEVLAKLRQVDLLNQLLPVALTKEQIEKILVPLEKCRALVKKTADEEAVILAKLDAQVTPIVKAGLEKGNVPNVEQLRSLAEVIRGMQGQRAKVAFANTTAMTMAFTEATNKGQQRAAANAYSPKLVDPDLKLEELTEERRLQIWIQDVLLDPLTYDVLVAIAKRG